MVALIRVPPPRPARESARGVRRRREISGDIGMLNPEKMIESCQEPCLRKAKNRFFFDQKGQTPNLTGITPLMRKEPGGRAQTGGRQFCDWLPWKAVSVLR